jgi:mono/diheme cytochrome c family protein
VQRHLKARLNIIVAILAVGSLALLLLLGREWNFHGAGGAHAGNSQSAGSTGDQGAPTGAETCCKAGDTRLPVELIEKVPPGGLHSPYQEYAKLAKEEELVKQFRLPGCNECHGGTGGGGFCPALSQGVWFWGNTDDVLFRLIALGSLELEKRGFQRLQWGSVHGPMPPMAVSIKSADQLWKIIAFIRSINPPGTNPPEKVIPGKMKGESRLTRPMP